MTTGDGDSGHHLVAPKPEVATIPQALKALAAMERELEAAETYVAILKMVRAAEALKHLLGQVAEVKQKAEWVVLAAYIRIGEKIKKVPKASGGDQRSNLPRRVNSKSGRAALGVPVRRGRGCRSWRASVSPKRKLWPRNYGRPARTRPSKRYSARTGSPKSRECASSAARRPHKAAASPICMRSSRPAFAPASSRPTRPGRSHTTASAREAASGGTTRPCHSTRSMHYRLPRSPLTTARCSCGAPGRTCRCGTRSSRPGGFDSRASPSIGSS